MTIDGVILRRIRIWKWWGSRLIKEGELTEVREKGRGTALRYKVVYYKYSSFVAERRLVVETDFQGFDISDA